MSQKEQLYFDLRKEILDKSKKIDNISTFCVTTMVAIFAIAFKSNPPVIKLVLLPIIIIIFESIKVYITRCEIFKISEYIIRAKLEDPEANWEEVNRKLTLGYNKTGCKIKNKILSFLKNIEYLLMVLVCIVIYVYNVGFTELLKNPCLSVLLLIISIVEFVIMLKLSKVKKIRKKYKKLIKRLLAKQVSKAGGKTK